METNMDEAKIGTFRAALASASHSLRAASVLSALVFDGYQLHVVRDHLARVLESIDTELVERVDGIELEKYLR
jgi:hypothetical protein